MAEYPEIRQHNSWVTWTQDEQPLPEGAVCSFCDHPIPAAYVEVLRTYWASQVSTKFKGTKQKHLKLHPECAVICGFRPRSYHE